VGGSVDTLQEMLVRDEGYREQPYLDHRGNPTGGFGQRIPSLIMPEHEFSSDREYWASRFFDKIEQVEGQRKSLDIQNLNPSRQAVVSSMIYQMGFKGFKGFKETIRALRMGDYKRAADEMLDSDWHRDPQTKDRARRAAGVMRLGRFPTQKRMRR